MRGTEAFRKLRYWESIEVQGIADLFEASECTFVEGTPRTHFIGFGLEGRDALDEATPCLQLLLYVADERTSIYLCGELYLLSRLRGWRFVGTKFLAKSHEVHTFSLKSL